MVEELKRPYRLVVYRDGLNRFTWVLKSGNGQILANSVQSYGTARHANRAAQTLAEAFILVDKFPEPV